MEQIIIGALLIGGLAFLLIRGMRGGEGSMGGCCGGHGSHQGHGEHKEHREDKGSKTAEMVKDPVCGMTIGREEAATSRWYRDNVFYFCSSACAERFDKAPEQYAKDVEVAVREV
jgi:YHS domain-containing protein